MKILICGAGIAGLTLAYWLHQDGHQPIVIEKASDLRSSGYIIDFVGSGYDIAHRMGLIPQLTAKSHQINQIVYVDRHGNIDVRFPIEKIYRAANINGGALTLDRRDLVETLYDTVRSNVEIRFGVSLQAVCQSADSATATSTEGTHEDFDLIIGADGIHSMVRRLVMGDETNFARYLGYRVAAFYTPNVPAQSEDGYLMHVEPHVQFGVYRVAPDNWLVYAVYRHDDEGYIAPEQRLDTLRRHLKDAGWIIPDVLQNIPPGTPIFLDTVTQIQMSAWSSNRVVLIGDAAYCLTLISGQGASMAMAGAYFLAEELKRTSDYQAAFTAYERRLRPHIEHLQHKARKFAPTFIPNSRLRIKLTHWALRLADFPPVSKLIGNQINVSSLIK